MSRGAVEYGQLNSTVHKYHLNRVLLQEGTNTIVFRVKDRRTVPDQKYTFYMDSFTLTPLADHVSLDHRRGGGNDQFCAGHPEWQRVQRREDALAVYGHAGARRRLYGRI
ncbi:hypothetical protein [Cohnella rhizosphaerae]|uniref:Uncharacterized protein n=1 Tax=Cohnella rhizosphaerae TaxID=1457232 RepID=A0A9X4KZY2_9BACL|nr:hypothetical protein [Cohnella rhizosphaerae]MDG0813963.1 hypothetical protein [Cohnella rhizosphaerae]